MTIGVYAGDALVGSGVMEHGRCGIAVWGDDPTTEEIDGASEGEALTLKRLIEGNLVEADCEILSGELTYKTDALAVVELNASESLPKAFSITSVYPNPFNSVTHIGYVLPEAVDVNLLIYDVAGRLVNDLVKGKLNAGVHTAVFDGAELPSGIYMIKLDACGQISQVKVALVK